jgi:hypothetical protein
MDIHQNASKPVEVTSSAVNQVPHQGKSPALSEKLLRVKEAAATGDYARAIQILPADNRAPEFQNCRAVCLIRMQRFEDAIGALRAVVLNQGTLAVHTEVPRHYVVNLATALFFGGRQAGAYDLLAELSCEEDEKIRQLRQLMGEWERSMSFLARLDWKVNRIAPKKQPTAPDRSLGQFTWDLS